MSLSRFLPGLAFAALAACIPVHDGVSSDGTDGNLSFGGDAHEKTPLAVGFPVEATVARFDAQWNTCVIMKSEGTHTQGCSSDPEPLDWVSGACEDPSLCSVELVGGQGGGALTIRVTGLAEGSTRVRVNVKSAHDSASWSDAFPVSILKATKIFLDGASTKYAYLPGKSLRWCPVLQNVTGDVTTNLLTPLSAVTSSVEGSSLTASSDAGQPPTSCVDFTAANEGTTSIAFRAGPLDRTVSVRIGEPNAITAMELRPQLARDPADLIDADDDPLLGTNAQKSFQLDVRSYGLQDYVSVVTLGGGMLALGGAGRVTVNPVDLAKVYVGVDSPIAESKLSLGSSIRTGKGTLEADFGAVHFSAPLEVIDSTLGKDAGHD